MRVCCEVPPLFVARRHYTYTIDVMRTMESSASASRMEEDPFDGILTLEDRFYSEGYQLGVTDGSKAGRIEGRAFGLEKGFEKYIAMGIRQGQAAVWAGRLPRTKSQHGAGETYTGSISSHEQAHSSSDNIKAREASATLDSPELRLPSLPDNPRLEKHIISLYALVEAASLSTENTEDAVSDFDDRFKRANAKAKIIGRLIGEAIYSMNDVSNTTARPGALQSSEKQGSMEGDASSNIEDVSNLHRARQ